MTEEEKRKHRCCFTGHRPEKIGIPAWLVREQLQKEIQRVITQGYTTFISGMSRGVDLWAAQISMGAYQVRNYCMVRHSALLIAAYTGASGGTCNTIEYAKKTGNCEIRYLMI